MAEKEYIEREAVLRRMQKIATEAWKMRIKANVETVWNEAQDVLRFFPAADVREVKRGKWIYNEAPVLGNPYGSYRCTACLQAQDHKSNYCPNCGADMREES